MSMQHYTIENLLDRLCEHFDEELERQQNMLIVCRALGRAARAQDHEYLEAKTAALHVLIHHTVTAEQTRIALVREVVNHYQIPEGRQTLSGLIAVVPDPWHLRMREFQTTMKETLESTRALVRENNRVLRRSLYIVNETLAAMALCEPSAPRAYDASGAEQARTHSGPMLVDQRG